MFSVLLCLYIYAFNGGFYNAQALFVNIVGYNCNFIVHIVVPVVVIYGRKASI